MLVFPLVWFRIHPKGASPRGSKGVGERRRTPSDLLPPILASRLCVVWGSLLPGLMVYSVSSYFYAGDHNGKLEKYHKCETEIEALMNGKAQAARELD